MADSDAGDGEAGSADQAEEDDPGQWIGSYEGASSGSGDAAVIAMAESGTNVVWTDGDYSDIGVSARGSQISGTVSSVLSGSVAYVPACAVVCGGCIYNSSDPYTSPVVGSEGPYCLQNYVPELSEIPADAGGSAGGGYSE